MDKQELDNKLRELSKIEWEYVYPRQVLEQLLVDTKEYNTIDTLYYSMCIKTNLGDY